jgi:hypothetical protein
MLERSKPGTGPRMFCACERGIPQYHSTEHMRTMYTALHLHRAISTMLYIRAFNY